MAYLPRCYDYTPPGLWLAARLQVDPVPHTDLVGRSEHGIGAEAVIEPWSQREVWSTGRSQRTCLPRP